MIKPLRPFPKLGLKNRLVMAPMTRCFADQQGHPTARLGEYYIERARGGAGLIIVESCAVNSSDARGYLNGCQLSMSSHATSWRPIVDEVKQYGTKVWAQIFHAGRLTVPEICGVRPISSSDEAPAGLSSFWRPELGGELVHFQTLTPFQKPRRACDQDIDRIADEFTAAVNLAYQAGFDGVEIHGAHGYFLHGLFSKYVLGPAVKNRYEWGLNALEKIVRSCRREADKHGLLMSFRLSTHMIDNNFLSLKDQNLSELIPQLSEAGIDVFHSSELQVGQPAFRSKMSLGEAIRQYTGKPIIGCGGLTSLSDGDALLSENTYDLIAFGRALMKSNLVPVADNDGKFDYRGHFDKL